MFPWSVTVSVGGWPAYYLLVFLLLRLSREELFLPIVLGGVFSSDEVVWALFLFSLLLVSGEVEGSLGCCG